MERTRASSTEAPGKARRRCSASGGSFDVQKDYKSGGADPILVASAGGRQGVTLQVGWSRADGGDFIAALPKQDVILLEGGYHLHGGRFTPFFQYNARDFDRAALADQQTYQVGVAFWLKGHARNVKASVGEQRTDGRPNRLQALLQLQVFSY